MDTIFFERRGWVSAKNGTYLVSTFVTKLFRRGLLAKGKWHGGKDNSRRGLSASGWHVKAWIRAGQGE